MGIESVIEALSVFFSFQQIKTLSYVLWPIVLVDFKKIKMLMMCNMLLNFDKKNYHIPVFDHSITPLQMGHVYMYACTGMHGLSVHIGLSIVLTTEPRMVSTLST
jgi:hypothetical protein